MEQNSPLAVVQAWQDAANSQNVEQLLELSDPNIEIVGPRGSGYGHQLLHDWLGRAGLYLQTRRALVRENIVVLAQYGVWRSVETGELLGEMTVASQFRVDKQRVAFYARHDSLDTALEKAGLTPADEQPLPTEGTQPGP